MAPSVHMKISFTLTVSVFILSIFNRLASNADWSPYLGFNNAFLGAKSALPKTKDVLVLCERTQRPNGTEKILRAFTNRVKLDTIHSFREVTAENCQLILYKEAWVPLKKFFRTPSGELSLPDVFWVMRSSIGETAWWYSCPMITSISWYLYCRRCIEANIGFLSCNSGIFIYSVPT